MSSTPTHRIASRNQVMEMFASSVGVPLTIDEITNQIGCRRSTVSGIITRLINNGWKFAKPSKSSYTCLEVGSIVMAPGTSTRRQPTSPVLPLGAVPAPVVPAPVVPAPVVAGLVVGSMLEVIYVTQAGTLVMEDTEGNTYVVGSLSTLPGA